MYDRTWCIISYGNHVRFSHFALLAVSEDAKTCLQFFFRSVSKKTIITVGSVLVKSRIIKLSVMVISLLLQLITPTLPLIYSGYHKTSSNNCLETGRCDLVFVTVVEL